MKNITLLIHGPFQDNAINKISEHLHSIAADVQKIVYVMYEGDDALYGNDVANIFKEYNLEIVKIKDLINPGFANINRQIVSVQAGLSKISDDQFVIKLRNDQFINFKKFVQIIKSANIDFMQEKKIITTNCYTRKDRYYHPSDMFIAASALTLKEYYNAPLSNRTELEVQMNIKELMEKEKISYNPFSPESYLFRNFLKKNNWDFKETQDDSLKSLKKYVYLLNSWDIDLKWKKKRVFPFKKENDLVLPHRMTLSPFHGGPIERIRCYNRCDILDTNVSIKDLYYLLKIRIIWQLWKANQESIFYHTKHNKRKQARRKFFRELLKCFPYFLTHKKIEKLNRKIHG